MLRPDGAGYLTNDYALIKHFGYSPVPVMKNGRFYHSTPSGLSPEDTLRHTVNLSYRVPSQATLRNTKFPSKATESLPGDSERE